MILPADGRDPEPDGEGSRLGRDEQAELERLRAENAEFRRAADALKPPKRHGRHAGWWRALLSSVLIVLGCVIAPVAVLGVWAGEEVSNTDRWVATVGPLINNPAIQNFLTNQITDQITSQIDLTANINRASAELNGKGLPQIASLLKTFGSQISAVVTGFIHSTVQSIITSNVAADAWVLANRVAHQALVEVLSGQGSGAISSSNGQVVVNLAPFIAIAKKALVERGFTLANSVPRVNATVVLFESEYLGKAQAAYQLITTGKLVLPVVALLLLIAGVFAARSRRQALLGTGLGVAASMFVLGVALAIFRAVYLNSVPSDVLPGTAAAAMFDAFASFLSRSLRAVGVTGLAVAIAAFFTGPGRAAVTTRSALKSWLAWLRHFGERRGVSTGPVGRWAYAHRRILRIGGTAFAVLAVIVWWIWGQPTALVIIVIGVILLAALGLIELIGIPVAERGTANQA